MIHCDSVQEPGLSEEEIELPRQSLNPDLPILFDFTEPLP